MLGANDGIVSVAGIVLGVAGATAQRGPIFTAGLAGLVAGAVSMAFGEYIPCPANAIVSRPCWPRSALNYVTCPTPNWLS